MVQRVDILEKRSGVPGSGRNREGLRNHDFVVNRRFILIFIVIILLIGIPVVEGATDPGILCVNTTRDDCTSHYDNITYALKNASNYATIYVGPGLYKERITISKQLTLKGATAGHTKKSYDVPTESDNYRHDYYISESIIDPETAVEKPVVTISSGNVTFDGFIVSMTVALKPTSAYPATDLLRVDAVNASNIVIQNNVFGPNLNLTNNDGISGRMGITISKFSQTGDNSAYNIQIRDNKIYDLKGDSCGILMTGVKNTSTDFTNNPPKPYQFKGTIIDNNEITGIHRSAIDFSGGMQGSPTEHIKITNNIISNNGWFGNAADRDNIKWGNGIALMRMTNQNESIPWASRYIDIENNVFSNNEKNGIYIGPISRNITIKNNTIQNNGLGTGGVRKWDGIRIDLDEEYQQKERILQNEPSTDQLTIYDHLTNISIEKNTISGNGGYGLQVIKRPQKGTIDASNNWWGDTTGPQQAISNPSGKGDAVSDNVEFAPWLTKSDSKIETRTTASGSGAVLVVSKEPDSYNFTTIQSAINAARTGNTIKVYPGTYDERIFVNRSITLLGATSGISKKDYSVPTEYVYDATKESIIKPSGNENKTVVEIMFSNVVFDGFIVAHTNQISHASPANTHLISLSNSSYDYTDVKIQNTVIGPNTNDVQDGTKGRMGIAVPGPSQQKVYNLTISNNKIFDALGDGCGILLLGSQNKTTPATSEKYKRLLIDNNTISGNHRSGIEFSGGVQGSADTAGHIRITNNNITNNGWLSTADKDNVKYGHGIILIRIGSDKSEYKNQYSSAWGSRYVDIDNNVISNNEKNGIYIGPSNRYISITNNILSKNGAGTGGYSTWDGVRVDLDEAYHSPNDKNYGNLTKIVLKSNDIIDNGDYGVRVIQTPSLGPIEAENNWWGSASGPRATTDAAGTASNVSSNVDYSPWYTTPIKSAASTLPKPMATFTVDPIEGMVRDTSFSFDASASESQSKSTITSYQWDYGDGNKSTASNSPITTWIYEVAKVQTITLTVKDSKGMTNTTTRQVTVIAKREEVPLKFDNATEKTGADGTQELVVKTGGGNVINTTTNLTITNPGDGWEEMTVTGNTTGGGADPITIKNITQVVLKGKPIVTELDTTPGGVGAVSTSIQLALTNFTSAPLQVEVTQGANSTISSGFQLAAGSGNTVKAVAYTMTIKGTSSINSNLSKSSDPVVLNMSVSEEWVNANGGLSAIKVIRYSDDGSTKEVLETQYLFTSGSPAMYYFKVISPNGCSIFGVASIVAVPQSSSGTTGGGTSSQSGVEGDSSDPVGSVGEKGPAEQKAPLQLVEEKSAVPEPSSAPVQAQYTQGAPLDTPEDNGEIPFAGPAEKELTKSFGGVFAFIADNIVMICMGAAAIVLGVGLLVWNRRRQEYWR